MSGLIGSYSLDVETFVDKHLVNIKKYGFWILQIIGFVTAKYLTDSTWGYILGLMILEILFILLFKKLKIR